MQPPANAFKAALRNGRPQIGLWLGLADAYVSELLASTGFDWLAIDAEHAPNDLRSVLAQLQALAPYPVQAVVRTASGEATLLKQYLDIGAQTLLVPMVESAEQAARIVAATRYPPAGIRGVGSALARKSACWFRWNPLPAWTVLPRSPQPRAWTAYSSDPPTSPRRWACWGRQAMRECRRRSRTASRRCGLPERPQAC